jgi:hypothetical protein
MTSVGMFFTIRPILQVFASRFEKEDTTMTRVRIVAMWLYVTSLAFAGVPHQISYQGRITDTDGMPVNSTPDVTITIFEDETGITQLWSESHDDVPVVDGLFDVILGSVNPIPESVFTGEVRWLGVQVDGGPMSEPLTAIVSSAYAFRSGVADSLADAHWFVDDGVLQTDEQYGLSRGGADNQVLGLFKNTMVNLGHHSTVGQSGLVDNSTISGGGYHHISQGASTICGGLGDTITGGGSTIAGGAWNTLSGNNSWMGGGYYCRNGGNYSVIVGGRHDTIDVGVSDSYLFGFNSRLSSSNTFMIDMPHIRFGDEVDGYEFPATDGTSGQTLVTDGAGQLSWSSSGGGNGWTDDGSVVRLNNPADKVGIGTASPQEALQVNGKVIIGSASNIGRVRFYGDRSEDPFAQIMQNGATYGAGGELHLAGPDGGSSISLDGNFIDAPRVEFDTPDESVVFDLSYEGDNCVQFPNKAINNLEILNEAGVGNTRRTTGSVTFMAGDPVTEILWRPMAFPTAGYAVVIATAQISVNHNQGTGELVYLGVSDQDDALPSGLTFRELIPGGTESSAFNDIVTVHGYFPVDAGINNFYLLGMQQSGSFTTVYDIEMTVMFFPSNYALVIKGEDSGEGSEYQPGEETAATMDDVIAAQMEQQTRSLRSRYDRELNELREENQQLLKRLEAIEASLK